MDERSRHRLFEDQFLAQLRARAAALVGSAIPADGFVVEATGEGADAVRAELSRLRVYDRDALEKLPGSRSVEMRFTRRVLAGLLRRTASRVRARSLSPVEALLDGRPPPPLGREDVLDALARYEILPRRERPDAVVLASATGFSPEAMRLAESPGPPTLILLGAREDGGWDVAMPASVRKSPWARLFELETRDDRLRRLQYHLEKNADLLDSRGISLTELAEQLGLSAAETEAVLRQACRNDNRLMTVVHDGVTHVSRAPLAMEGDTMSIWSRLRKLLGFKPTVAEQVRTLSAQRVTLERQRYELDQRVERLEREEREALQQGKEAYKAGNQAVQKQVADKLQRVRRELGRTRAQTQMYTQQIDVIGTHIHHLTLAEQGRRMELPKAEQLTATAAEAEQMMSELSANAELARSIEVTGETPVMEQEQASIFAEFAQMAESEQQAAAAPESASKVPAREAQQATRAAPTAEGQRAASPAADRSPERPQSARPEMS